MSSASLPRFYALILVLVLGACSLAPAKPVFQPLTLDLSGDIAPRDPALAAVPDVYCVAGHGTAMITSQWRAYKTTGFVLPGAGMMSSIKLEPARGAGDAVMRGYYDEAGQKMVFCPLQQGPPDQVIECQSLYALNEDLSVGIKRTFDVPDAIQGGHISCAYDQANIQPL